MAAITPSSLVRESSGSLTQFFATFAGTADDGDTWASGLGSNVVGFSAVGTDDPTQTKEGIDVSESSGTFTFNLGEDNRSFILTVWARV